MLKLTKLQNDFNISRQFGSFETGNSHAINEALDLQLYKKETLTQVFSCEFSENFKGNTYFYIAPLVAAS